MQSSIEILMRSQNSTAPKLLGTQTPPHATHIPLFRHHRIRINDLNRRTPQNHGSLPHQRRTGHLSALPLALPSLLLDLAFAPPPQCFDAECQGSKDAAYIASLVFPLLAFIAGAVIGLRPRPPSPDSKIIEDKKSGTVFEAPQEVEPARDMRGELMFRAISYTPWPVDAGAEGEPVRIEVGVVGDLTARTFLFEKALPQPSQIVVVRMPRPLGIVFEEDARMGRAVVAQLVPGGNAEQRRKRASLDPGMAATAPLEGDVLRGCTTTNIVYPAGALMFGVQTPERAIVVYGADGQRWPAVATALKRGFVADGEVTLVLERRVQREKIDEHTKNER